MKFLLALSDDGRETKDTKKCMEKEEEEEEKNLLQAKNNRTPAGLSIMAA